MADWTEPSLRATSHQSPQKKKTLAWHLGRVSQPINHPDNGDVIEGLNGELSVSLTFQPETGRRGTAGPLSTASSSLPASLPASLPSLPLSWALGTDVPQKLKLPWLPEAFILTTFHYFRHLSIKISSHWNRNSPESAHRRLWHNSNAKHILNMEFHHFFIF